MTDRPHVPRANRIPPPLLFAAAFGVGLLAQRALRLGAAPAMAEGLRALGVGLTAGGILLGLWAAGLFASQRTTIVPHGSSSALVLRGPYRFSRNPMYVALGVVYVGVTLWTHTWVALPLLVVPLWVVNRVIIPMEEAQLGARFGEAYADYSRRVRRWL